MFESGPKKIDRATSAWPRLQQSLCITVEVTGVLVQMHVQPSLRSGTTTRCELSRASAGSARSLSLNRSWSQRHRPSSLAPVPQLRLQEPQLVFVSWPVAMSLPFNAREMCTDQSPADARAGAPDEIITMQQHPFLGVCPLQKCRAVTCVKTTW